MTELMTCEELFQQAAAFMAQCGASGVRAWHNPVQDLSLVPCGGPDGTLTFACRTTPEMANIIGIVHGGVTASLVDTCMGIVCGCQAGCVTPTISMTVNYAQPVPLDAVIHVRTHIIRCGATSGQMWAEVFLADDQDHILVTATGIYSTKR